jgi:hypothetical protein
MTFTVFLMVFLANGPQTVAAFVDPGICEGVRAALTVTENGKPVRTQCVKGFTRL